MAHTMVTMHTTLISDKVHIVDVFQLEEVLYMLNCLLAENCCLQVSSSELM